MDTKHLWKNDWAAKLVDLATRFSGIQEDCGPIHRDPWTSRGTSIHQPRRTVKSTWRQFRFALIPFKASPEFHCISVHTSPWWFPLTVIRHCPFGGLPSSNTSWRKCRALKRAFFMARSWDRSPPVKTIYIISFEHDPQKY